MTTQGGVTGRLGTVDVVGRRRGRLLRHIGQEGGEDVAVVEVADVCLIKVGGTVRDIESSMFLPRGPAPVPIPRHFRCLPLENNFARRE